MDVATWNVPHDGRVIASNGSVPGDVRLPVEIAYLCSHLSTEADSLFVALTGCERFEYRPYEQPPVTDPTAIARLSLELLSAGLEGGRVEIECSDGGYGGRLSLVYSSAQLSTAEGRSLSQSEVELASERYWSLWRQRHAEPVAAPDRC